MNVKYAILILFVAAVLSQVFSDLIMYTAFKSNQSFIAANLCVNKSHPERHCNGCCYMAKQIKKEKEDQKSATNNFNKKNSITDLYCICYEKLILPIRSIPLVFNFSFYHFTNPALLGVFRPPKVLA